MKAAALDGTNDPISQTLLRGYRAAYDRWMAGARISTDPAEAFLTIFEALNWATVIDDRLRQDVGPDWATADPQGALVAGFRYARNTVHHDWSDALHVTSGAVLPSPLPVGFFEWRWRPTLPAKKKRGVTQYGRHLAISRCALPSRRSQRSFAALLPSGR